MGVVCNRGLVDLICCEQYIRATGFGIIRLDEDYSALSCLYDVKSGDGCSVGGAVDGPDGSFNDGCRQDPWWLSRDGARLKVQATAADGAGGRGKN
ncbi:hypothetical protein DEO72_LG3g1019 [Vigna unguiculata]|uniref:Uncharacterized protein n=1 Tax=Vigna unguiculata TaxID=3917 RepID=A0A4D6LDL8_VIGUN|nr:hypothetical protein DEO72_LG3g1019 [Vigna unguiculata]